MYIFLIFNIYIEYKPINCWSNDGKCILIMTCLLCILPQPILSISFPFEFLGPVPGKFMIGTVGNFTLQPMARINHKFPGYGVWSVQKSTVYKHVATYTLAYLMQ